MTERRYTKEAFDADPEWFEQVVCEDMAEEIVHRTEWLVECKAEVKRLREENRVLRELVEIELALDRGEINFPLHSDATDRLREAWAAYFAMTEATDDARDG